MEPEKKDNPRLYLSFHNFIRSTIALKLSLSFRMPYFGNISTLLIKRNFVSTGFVLLKPQIKQTIFINKLKIPKMVLSKDHLC